VKFSLEAAGISHIIRGYGKGEIRVDQKVLTRSLLLGPGVLVEDWPPQSLGELSAEHLEQIVALDPEILVLGVGNRQAFPPPSVMAPLYRRRIGVEVMTTDAACRTYNVLRAEDRRVVAALLML
jgi:uncharacterized protein